MPCYRSVVIWNRNHHQDHKEEQEEAMRMKTREGQGEGFPRIFFRFERQSIEFVLSLPGQIGHCHQRAVPTHPHPMDQ